MKAGMSFSKARRKNWRSVKDSYTGAFLKSKL